ncbi:hypothetical protein ACFWG0_36420 [Streptomyces yangpuensis]|uniref:hypothetical protein n=1 Tax=Streptomyces yangpuensis TaxID=1648182 RepID=UPI003660BABD
MGSRISTVAAASVRPRLNTTGLNEMLSGKRLPSLETLLEIPPGRHHMVLIALLASCAGIYLAVGEVGFAGVISAVAALYGAWRARR